MSYDRMTEDGLTKLVTALHAAFTPNHEEIKKALQAIVNFNPEDTPIQFDFQHSVYNGIAKTEKAKAEAKEELANDAQCPFISESFLYNLLGKEDARTLLARFKALVRALGIDMDDLYTPCPGCGFAPHHGRCQKPEDEQKRRAAEAAKGHD